MSREWNDSIFEGTATLDVSSADALLRKTEIGGNAAQGFGSVDSDFGLLRWSN